MKIDRQRIVDEALLLLNEAGLDALSTRALAERLGIRQPALYWHFKGKRALIDAMNAEILRRGHTHAAPKPGDVWSAYLLANCRSFRNALLAYRDGGRVHAGTEADPQDLAKVETQIGLLVDAGMTPETAMELLVALGRYTLGCVIEEQAEPQPNTKQLDEAAVKYPLTSRAVLHYRDSGAGMFFEAGVTLMIEAAAMRLAKRQA
ncbi:TetR/AcrR family transcriptional regulator C-terminal domain-containing protein [Rhizobium sp. RAF36]|uniref:TetR/AcrR family transcriptional regulator C-terminal domain-containing protein n=1 Tax=Rhizobium sp. RAF36 TaxID=3233055 RepID=UPI00045FE4EF|nr:Tetracyclin repressor, C-terminal all-alpha domain protein [uncultured bacterium]